MKLIRSNYPMRPIRLLFAVCICAFVFFSSAFPAFAAAPSSPKRGGESNLLGIEEKAGELARETPLSSARTQTEANQGLNEIQGAADADKMNRPENSVNVPSAEQNVQQKLENAINKLQGKG